MTSALGKKQRPDWALALWLWALLVAVYALTYSGTFITDDEHILASRALSLAFDGNLNDLRVFGNGRVYDLANRPAVYAAQGVNIEPGQALGGASLARLAVMLGVGRVQALFLLNLWATALTAVVVLWTLRSLGYARSTALLVGLLFGLGTAAWPYAKTLFRDPLAMLFLTITWASGLVLAGRPGAPWRWWLVFFGAALAGMFTKNTVSIALPVLLVYIALSRLKHIQADRVRWARVLGWGGGVLLAAFLWLRFVPPDGALARFSLAYYQVLLARFFASPHPHFVEAVAGPFFSPGKSVFLYSPVLLLSLLGLARRDGAAWAAWSYALLLVVAQALFYDDVWWGEINWGLRFMLPALPPLMMATAPVVDSWLRARRGCWGLWALGLPSGLVQLLSVLPPIREYYREMASLGAEALGTLGVWRAAFSPLLWHGRWLLSGGALDLAAVRVGLRAATVVMGCALLIVWLVWGYRRVASWGGLPVMAALLVLGLTLGMLKLYAVDPAYHAGRDDLSAAYETIRQDLAPDDHVLLKSYGTAAWLYWMNWAGPGVHWASLPFTFPTPGRIAAFHASGDPEIALDKATLSILRSLAASCARVWLVLPEDSPGAALDLEVAWLRQHADLQAQWTFDGASATTRLYRLGRMCE